MKRWGLIAHLAIPALIAVGAFVFALRREPFGLEMAVAYLVGGFLFYAAPHLAWMLLAALAKFSKSIWHSGLSGATAALVAITVLSQYSHDPSGLPMQWLVYWPLAVILQVVSAGACAVYRWRNAAQL